MQMLEFQHKCSSGFLRTTLLFACFGFFWQLQIVLLSVPPPPQKKKKKKKINGFLAFTSTQIHPLFSLYLFCLFRRLSTQCVHY